MNTLDSQPATLLWERTGKLAASSGSMAMRYSHWLSYSRCKWRWLRDDLIDSFPGRLDQGHEPHRLMVGPHSIHDRLPGQAGAQVALGTGHNPKAADYVVVDLATAAVALRIH